MIEPPWSEGAKWGFGFIGESRDGASPWRMLHNLEMLDATILPASRFPERADEYECDKCGRFITKHLFAGRAHVERPIGRERYRCRCGETYLSGAAEWDHLGDWERSRRAKMLLFVCSRFLLPALLVVVFAYLAVRYHNYWLLAVCMLVSIPTIVFLCLSAFSLFELVSIAASLWRTRVSGRIALR
jgi:hypothetical protein